MNLKTLFLSLAVVSGAAGAGQTACYEADKWDETARTPWSHQYFVARLGPIERGPFDRKFRWIFGYGYNDAGDIVPFTGSSVQDDEKRWVVSILGTLHQHSTLLLHDDVPEIRYWIISQAWEAAEPGPLVDGNSHNGNLISPFGEAFPVTHDDSYDAHVWRIPCEEVPR